MGVLLVAVDHNQLRTMASQTVDLIDWLYPRPLRAVPPDLHVLHCVNVAYKSQDLLEQPALEHASTGMPGQCTGHSGYMEGMHLCIPVYGNFNVLYVEDS